MKPTYYLVMALVGGFLLGLGVGSTPVFSDPNRVLTFHQFMEKKCGKAQPNDCTMPAIREWNDLTRP